MRVSTGVSHFAAVFLALAAGPIRGSDSGLAEADSAEARLIAEAGGPEELGAALRILLDGAEKELAAGGTDRVHNLPERIAAAAAKIENDGSLDGKRKKTVLRRLRRMKWTAEKAHEYADGNRPKAARQGMRKLREEGDKLEEELRR